MSREGGGLARNHTGVTMKSLFGSAFLALVLSGPAFAGAPSDAVRYFYSNIGSETEPDNRDRFTGLARAALDANEQAANGGGAACIDFILALDSPDLDQNEIDSSLALNETADGPSANVTADFTLFRQPHEVEWSLQEVDGVWKVADIASRSGNWRLSTLRCR
jgi:hypothetical protein